jgi:hypothetical protein
VDVDMPVETSTEGVNDTGDGWGGGMFFFKPGEHGISRCEERTKCAATEGWRYKRRYSKKKED